MYLIFVKISLFNLEIVKNVNNLVKVVNFLHLFYLLFQKMLSKLKVESCICKIRNSKYCKSERPSFPDEKNQATENFKMSTLATLLWYLKLKLSSEKLTVVSLYTNVYLNSQKLRQEESAIYLLH